MPWTVNDYQLQIASEIDQSDSAPDQGSTDWNIRLRVLNRAQIDWAESYDWEVNKKVFNGLVSTSSANASIVMPTGFRKPDGFPKITYDGVTTAEFTPVNVSRNSQYSDTDKIVNFLGNEKDRFVMVVRGATLVSGASIQLTYWASPVSLASAVDISPIPDPTYLVQRSLYYLYKGREDARFPEAKAESEKILMRMLENENTLGIANSDNRIHKWNETRYAFKIGRD